MRQFEFNCPAAERLIRLPELVARTGIPRSTLYYLIQKGKFPKPQKLGRASVWKWSEIDRFLSDPSRHS